MSYLTVIRRACWALFALGLVLVSINRLAGAKASVDSLPARFMILALGAVLGLEVLNCLITGEAGGRFSIFTRREIRFWLFVAAAIRAAMIAIKVGIFGA